MNRHWRGLVSGATAGCLTAVVGQAQGAGFAIIEQGVTGLGNAYAGGAAVAEDASTIFFNPAGMTRLYGTHLEAGVHVISPTTEFRSSGTSQVVGAATVPLTGNDGGEAGETGVVPNFYYVRELGRDMRFGLGVNAPFGLATDYARGWEGRYHALRSELATVNINPAFAWKVTDRLSLGAGVNIQYIEAKLSQAVDFPTVCAGLFAAGVGAAGACAGAPTTSDGEAELEGDDWGWGFNAGLMYELDRTRFGLAYRSKVDQKLEGDVDFNNTPGALQGLGIFIDDGVSAQVSLPEMVSLSIHHELNPKVAIMGDVTWTNWSRFDELRVKFDTNPQADLVTPEEWDDSWRYSLGLSYRYNDSWTLRTGVAYDQTPIPSAELRTPRIPGNDRKWLALGASYRQSDRLQFDVGYAHLFVSDTPINNTNNTGATLVGSYESSVDILSAQLRWSFD